MLGIQDNEVGGQMGKHTHKHSHGHTHGYTHEGVNGSKMLWTVLLNLIITVAEFVGGIVSNSLALLSDALHNLSDTIAIFISYLAMKIGRWPPDKKNTFGYKRYEILAAFINALVLIGISGYLFIEAWHRFWNPEPILIWLMLVVSVLGLGANLLSMLLLKGDSHHNLNVRSAYLHLLGDTLSSVGVIVGAVVMYYWHWFWLDPLVTVVVGVLIIKHALVVLFETVNILAMSAPIGVDNELIKLKLEEFADVANIHHIHLWQLHDKAIHFECHVDLRADISVSEADKLRELLSLNLRTYYGITHTTIQMEYKCCTNSEMIVTP